MLSDVALTMFIRCLAVVVSGGNGLVACDEGTRIGLEMKRCFIGPSRSFSSIWENFYLQYDFAESKLTDGQAMELSVWG